MMDIIRRRSIVLILFLVFLFFTQNFFILSLGTMNNNIICKPSERRALLSFKQHLNDSSNSLSSWSGENCCRWAGVVCSNTTHHVVQLHLQQRGLGGELNPSLLELKQLRHLDLSLNDFQGISIPDFLGSLQSLRYLDLSSAGFSGMIPHQLGNLSNLHYLDLRNSLALVGAGNFHWISHLSSLKHLDLSDVNLENASHCLQAISMLPSLLFLRLFNCSLSSGAALPTSLSHVNFTSLEVLDLQRNKLNSTIPEWLYSLTNLQQLDLSFNSFHGTISPSIGNLTKLTRLDFSNNRLIEGEIPSSIGRLSLLERLVLGNNKLNGFLPESLGNLSELINLDITGNAFEVVVSELHFANMTNLQYLLIDSVVLKMSPGWVPPFQLRSADLGTCQIGPGFPMWLRTQKILRELVLSNTGISGTIPTWFWNMTDNIFFLDLSNNELNGELPKVLNGIFIKFRSNKFSGKLPRVNTNVERLDLSNNSLSGSISTFLCNPISEINLLSILDLSDNLLSGNLSDCWVYWTSLMTLRLGGNKITGRIPSSLGSLLLLQALHLSDNSLSGELPSSLRNCTLLNSIDLGENGFTGRLPIWLGESFQQLHFLRLRSNKFYNEIPLEFCRLASIRVLDIAHNHLRGSIPKCFNKLSAINEGGFAVENWYLVGYVDRTTLVTKGRELEYGATLSFFTSLDLSKNNLSGEIPEELTSLFGLISFNLSWNCFMGKIPEKIGNMSLLESLDFSNNNISGVIPQSISGLSSLGHLDLSYNNLSGKIPLGTQLQSFNESSFIGNQELCGPPLNKCNGEEPTQKPGDRADEDDEDWFEMKWFYMSMGVGFVFGFWVFCGVMVLKGSWRIAYFRFLDETKDKLYLLF